MKTVDILQNTKIYKEPVWGIEHTGGGQAGHRVRTHAHHRTHLAREIPEHLGILGVCVKECRCPRVPVGAAPLQATPHLPLFTFLIAKEAGASASFFHFEKYKTKKEGKFVTVHSE